jgi:zinc transporter
MTVKTAAVHPRSKHLGITIKINVLRTQVLQEFRGMLKIKWYVIDSGVLREKPVPAIWTTEDLGKYGSDWFDIEESEPEELRNFLKPLGLHPLVLDHCVGKKNSPGVISYESEILVEVPASFDRLADDIAYLRLVLRPTVLVTIRTGPMPSLDVLIRGMVAENAPEVHHLPQIVFMILDDLADLNVRAQIEVRDEIARMAKALVEDSSSISTSDLTRLRQQIDTLVSLTENQSYSVAGLSASDNKTLQDPHQKAYLQDLLSEAEIAQRGIYRLESRLNDLNAYYQMASSDRVDKRLRMLTILSVITLPLGLIAGLLGMNVGGVPGLTNPNGFAAVVISMIILMIIELWFFKRGGWFD